MPGIAGCGEGARGRRSRPAPAVIAMVVTLNLNHLQDEGWTVHYYPAVITHSGLIPCTAAAALSKCGVAPAAAPRQPPAKKTVRKILAHTLNYNCTIRNTHKRLGRETALQQRPP